MPVYTIEGAMSEALGHLSRIASHFRKHGQHNTANELGKLSHMIINAFSEGAEHIPSNNYLLTNEDMQDNDSQASVSTPTVVHNIQKQAVAALMSEADKGQGIAAPGPFAGPVQSPKLSARENQPLHPGSWAQVASSLSVPGGLQGLPGDTAQYMSPVSLASMSASKQSQNSDDDEADPRAPASAAAALGLTPAVPGGRYPAAMMVAPAGPEIPEAKAGIIRVYGRVSKDVIQFITTRIHEGPLQDIRLETNGRTKVTFQHASHALAFLKSNQEMEQMLGFGRFGVGYQVELAEVVDWNDDHRRMSQPIRERRRLSFARKRLFAENMSPEKWKQDIRTLAGPGTIDFLWVFNSGNATAVFTSTVVARKVLEAFNRWKDGRNVYSGVSVTYSSDPCEKELVLVKETSRPNGAKNYLKRSMR